MMSHLTSGSHERIHVSSASKTISTTFIVDNRQAHMLYFH